MKHQVTLLLVASLLALSASCGHAATMTVRSGKVVDLTALSSNAKGKCCLSVKEAGLGVVSGDQTIVRMDGSGGKYFVTNDPQCGNSITASAYTTTFSYIYLCGQCKGGCPAVDGGKTLVPAGGNCLSSSGSYDITKACIASHPVCMSPGSGQCVTVEEATAKPPSPPAAVACASFSNLGQECNETAGKCCGGGPKNAKCSNGKCVSTYPTTGRRLAL